MRLIEHDGVRSLVASTTAVLADLDREPRDNAGASFGTRPVISLGPPRPAAGFTLSVAADSADSADGDTLTVTLFAVVPTAGTLVSNAIVEADHRLRLIGTLTCTLGGLTETIRSAGSGGADVTVRWADAMSFTLSPYGTSLLETVYGAAPGVFSPGDTSDSIAELIAPQIPNAIGVAVDATVSSGTADVYLDPRRIA